MSDELKKAIKEYENAERMFNFAVATKDIDAAIALMNAADLKFHALRKLITK